ncbi:F-box domain containing protein [Pandoravirus macleodensis]|uniref:F-box domain containing protein n=1 Tax=Pandoravirus macleodensis TaxID=2107707 RepID=A0A2U7UFB9_9VIRU|nr:F-box domain containing protein [Pandoravirus macleodensis]AVK77147.1 F-box domain containing protein [Pandoravirus macleodensis]
MATISDLPEELVIAIIRSTRCPRAALCLSATSKRYRRLATDKHVWQALYVGRYGTTTTSYDTLLAAGGKSWLWLYRARLPPNPRCAPVVGTIHATDYTYSGDLLRDKPHGWGIFDSTRQKADAIDASAWDTLPSVRQHTDGVALKPVGDGVARYWIRRYQGQCRDGRIEGFGVAHYANGDHYEGYWEGGQRHGHGIYVSDDWRIDSDWKDGECHGRTTVTCSQSTWTGDTHNGRFVGLVTLLYKGGGRVWGEWDEDEYTLHNTFHGTVFQTRPGASSYSGGCDHGQAHGFGVLTTPNGCRCQATWHHGNPSGPVVVTYPDGSQWEGMWACGYPDHECGVVTRHASQQVGIVPCLCLACYHGGAQPDDAISPIGGPADCCLDIFERAACTRPQARRA